MRRFENILNVNSDLLSSILLAENEIVLMIGLECKTCQSQEEREELRTPEVSVEKCRHLALVSSSLDTILVVLTL